MADRHATGQVTRAGIGLRTGTRRTGVAVTSALTLLLGLAGIVAAIPAQAGQDAGAAAATWAVVSTPIPAGAEISELSAVSCTSAKACTAVGSQSASLSSPIAPLADRWTGTRWRIQATPAPKGSAGSNFYGVSCASARACTAVGTAFFTKGSRNVNLAEAWNGTAWRVQTVPSPGDGQLEAVSCTAAKACTAVGFYDSKAGLPTALAERWNGSAWRPQTVRHPVKRTWLLGVSCSAARACTAVGYQNSGSGDAQPLTETWNGSTWRVHSVPLPASEPGGALSAVSCTAASACTATGSNFGGTAPTLAVRWNGTRWRVQPTPSPANFRTSFGEVSLDGVSCTSATACTASGEYSPGGLAAYFIEAWNGSRWRLVTAPVPAHFVSGALLGMSCAPKRCTAVGAWSGGVVTQQPLALAN
jgi:hypothetical protein